MPQTHASDRARMAALLVIMQAIFMELLNASLINVAIPSIKAGFNASPQAAQWLISGYALGFAVMLPAAGMLADRLGHKRVFLAGLALFTLASAGCGVAGNMGVLIAARAGQGMGNAMVAPQIMGFLQILFSPTERVSKLPWLGLASGTGATLGPLLAGAIIAHQGDGAGWRAVFAMDATGALITAVCGWFWLPGPQARKGASEPMDLPGAALLSAMAGALVAAMTVLGRWDRLALALGLLGLAGGLCLLAWRHLRARAAQGRQAMYPVALLGQRALWTGTLMTVCYASANGSFLVIFNVGLQHGRGHSAFEAGLLHLPFSLGVMAGVTLLARRWLVRHGRRVLAGGAVLAALGGSTVMTVLAMRGWPVAWALPAIVVAGVGVGLTSSSVAPVTLAWVDVRHAGMAAATLRLGQQVGAALGSAVIVRPYFAQQGSVSGSGSHWGEIAAIAPLLALLGLAALLALSLPLPLFPPPGGAARR